MPMTENRIIEFDLSKGYAIIDDERADPFDIIDAMREEGDTLLMHDLDSLHKNRQQLDVLQDMAEEAAIWYEGGLRYADSLIDPLVSGAAKVVVGNAYFRHDEYEKAIRMTDSVVIDVDADYPDRFNGYARSKWDNLALRRLVGEGYGTAIVSSTAVKDLTDLLKGMDLEIWVRTDETSDAFERMAAELGEGLTVAGRVASVRELLENND
jgi:hypothetical protein